MGIKPEWRGKYSKIWLNNAIRSFKPDIVYSFTHSFDTICYADWVSKKLNVPHVLHIADDSFASQNKEDVIKICNHARSHIAISTTMANHYSKIYGHNWKVFHNGAEAKFALGTRYDSYSSPFRIRFIGNFLLQHHISCIEDICDAVLELNKRGVPVTLELFGSQYPENCANKIIHEPYILHKGRFSFENKHEIISNSDLLLVPFTFNTDEFDHYRLSFPTKLLESLVTGIPTLIYGPKGMAGIDFCEDQKFGIVISKREKLKVREVLNSIIKTYPFYLNQASDTRQRVLDRYANDIVTDNFQKVIARN